MPLFDFKCPICQTRFEKLVKSDVVAEPCIKCGGTANKQLSAPGGFNLLGDGWYKGNASKPSSSSSSED